MRRYLALGLGAAAIALLAWARDGDGDHAPAPPPPGAAPSADTTPPVPSPGGGSPAARHPPRVIPRNVPVPRRETAPPPAEPAVAEPSPRPATPSRPPPAPQDELTVQVESAKALFADHDFEAAAAHSLEQLERHPRSFWLRSIAVKSLCAMGENEQAKEVIQKQWGLKRRKRLRIHCELQGGDPY